MVALSGASPGDSRLWCGTAGARPGILCGHHDDYNNGYAGQYFRGTRIKRVSFGAIDGDAAKAAMKKADRNYDGQIGASEALRASKTAKTKDLRQMFGVLSKFLGGTYGNSHSWVDRNGNGKLSYTGRNNELGRLIQNSRDLPLSSSRLHGYTLTPNDFDKPRPDHYLRTQADDDG